MAKKTFKNNPALQFINTESNDPEESREKINKEATIESEKNPPEGFKPNPLYVETKSKRLQLLMQPSLHAKIKKRAKKEKTSVNEYIHNILKLHIDEVE